MVIFEYIVLEVFELLIAKRTSMVPIDCLLNTGFAIYMSTSRYVTIINGIKANCTLKLSLKFLWTDLEVDVILWLFDDHMALMKSKNSGNGFYINLSTKNYFVIIKKCFYKSFVL